MNIAELKQLYRTATREEIMQAYSEISLEETDSSSRDDSLLHVACTMLDTQALELLLQRDLGANTRNKYGQTALFALARLRDDYQLCDEDKVRGCAKLLFDAGANVIRKDDDLGETPLTMAAQSGRFEIIEEAAAQGAKLTTANKNGDTAIHIACDYVRSALNSLKNSYGEDSEAEAAKMVDNYYKTVKALLDAGVDPQGKNDSNLSPLDIAITGKAEAIARLLAGVDERTPYMSLLRAVSEHNLNEVRLNAQHGADLNETEETGSFANMTPLTVACYTFDFPMVQLLLELGANPNYRDSKGRLPITPWFEYLGDFYYNGKLAEDKVPMQIINALIAAGLDKESLANDHSDTLLLAACNIADTGKGFNNHRLSQDILKVLLAAKCNPNCANLDGVTPLMLLCSKNDRKIPSLAADLLDASAIVDAVDKQGNTPLHYAARNTSANMGKEMAELLFDYGFSMADTVNNNGETALDLATNANNEPLVTLILTNM